jgi:hypothetical protein
MNMFVMIQNIDSHPAVQLQARIHGPITRRTGFGRCGSQAN